MIISSAAAPTWCTASRSGGAIYQTGGDLDELLVPENCDNVIIGAFVAETCPNMCACATAAPTAAPPEELDPTDVTVVLYGDCNDVDDLAAVEAAVRDALLAEGGIVAEGPSAGRSIDGDDILSIVASCGDPDRCDVLIYLCTVLRTATSC